MNIALIGNPNAGKSSVFNHLTGLRQKTGNFPGVTVDKHTGKIVLPDGTKATVIDFPGTYSLYPNSSDERIVVETLCNPQDLHYPDVVIYVADATHLERHLLLCSQLIDLRIPVVLALTMTDLALRNTAKLNKEKLGKSLGIPVVMVNGRTGSGIRDLIANLPDLRCSDKQFYIPNAAEQAIIQAIQPLTASDNPYLNLLIAHHYRHLHFISPAKKKGIEQALAQYTFNSIAAQVKETMARYDKITALLDKVYSLPPATHPTPTERIDRLLTHKVLGSIIFLGILFLVFQAIFAWASYPMEWIDEGFSKLSIAAGNHLPPSFASRLLVDGIIPGIAGICIFIPQIIMLFLLIAILEDIGYMSRAIFLSDKLMRKFGLNGRSIVALFSGLACAVPAIMATRTITSYKERLITIMVTPLMSCSARIPVFVMLIALVVPADALIGPFNVQGLVMLGLYLLGATAALMSAWIMHKILATEEAGFLVMELPTYKAPHWKNIALTVFEKVKVFVTEAGKIIIVISVLLWFLASYGPGDAMLQAERQVKDAFENTVSPEILETQVAAVRLENSYAGQLGKWLEPLIRPLGFDWKIGIALITSFAAREVFVGTMSTLYSLGSSDSGETVLEKLQTELNPQTGHKVFTSPVAASLLIFYVFAMQCMSTMAIVRRETKSWKWPLLQFLYMTVLAYLGSLITYQILS
ncbi:MAG: ferrous iron transport protein B [Chitinophagales bacterium]|nr:MAG: ferrous iron transport protein B [Chitinophagales bacterium]